MGLLGNVIKAKGTGALKKPRIRHRVSYSNRITVRRARDRTADDPEKLYDRWSPRGALHIAENPTGNCSVLGSAAAQIVFCARNPTLARLDELSPGRAPTSHNRQGSPSSCLAKPELAALAFGTFHLQGMRLAAAALDRSGRLVVRDQACRQIDAPLGQHGGAFGQVLRLADDLDVALHVLARPAARMRHIGKLREDEAQLGKEAEHLPGDA